MILWSSTEDWDEKDALYYVSTTLSTVGYGDQGGFPRNGDKYAASGIKSYTIASFYMLGGVFFTGWVISDISNWLFSSIDATEKHATNKRILLQIHVAIQNKDDLTLRSLLSSPNPLRDKFEPNVEDEYRPLVYVLSCLGHCPDDEVFQYDANTTGLMKKLEKHFTAIFDLDYDGLQWLRKAAGTDKAMMKPMGDEDPNDKNKVIPGTALTNQKAAIKVIRDVHLSAPAPKLQRGDTFINPLLLGGGH